MANQQKVEPSAAGVLLAAPTGTLELWPESAKRHYAMRDQLMRAFMTAGYQPVITPLVEYADLYDKTGDGDEALLRFSEPESGAAALIRPDITPQIVRMASAYRAELKTRAPTVWKLCYEGVVLRKPRGRARPEREIRQAGIECLGIGSVEADIEVADVLLRSLKACGLNHGLFELSHAGYWKDIFAKVGLATDALQRELMQLISTKDVTLLKSFLTNHRAIYDLIATLIDAYGTFDAERKAIERAEKNLTRVGLQAYVSGPNGLLFFYDALCKRHADVKLGFDLANVDGFHYYNGLRFSYFAEGPGQPIASGGRYDGLLDAYGLDWAAVGCGIDLHHLERALMEN